MFPQHLSPASFDLGSSLAFLVDHLAMTSLTGFTARREESVESVHHLTVLLSGLEGFCIEADGVLRTAGARHVWAESKSLRKGSGCIIDGRQTGKRSHPTCASHDQSYLDRTAPFELIDAAMIRLHTRHDICGASTETDFSLSLTPCRHTHSHTSWRRAHRFDSLKQCSTRKSKRNSRTV